MTSSPIKALGSDAAGVVAPEGRYRATFLQIHSANKQTMSKKEVTRERTEQKCAAAAYSQVNTAPAEQSSESWEIPAEIFKNLEENEADLKKWNEHIREKLTGLDSLLRDKKAENENLLAEIRILVENKKILTQQNKSLTAEVARLQRFIEENQMEIRNFNQKRYERDWRVGDAVYDKEAQMRFLIAEINTVQSTVHDLQERNKFLQDQNSHTVAVLTQVESQRETLKRRALRLKGAVQYLKNEIQEAEDQIMKNESEKKQLNRINADKQNQIDDLIKDREISGGIIQDLTDQLTLHQEEKMLADSEETMNPAAEPPPNSGSWFNSTKGLLVGLGLAVGGLLIYSAFWAT